MKKDEFDFPVLDIGCLKRLEANGIVEADGFGIMPIESLYIKRSRLGRQTAGFVILLGPLEQVCWSNQ